MARKEKYESHVKPHLKDIQHWMRDGIDEKGIFKRLGVSHQTWNIYKHKYPELVDAIKTGQQDINAQVEDSLLERARGHTYKTKHVHITQQSNGKTTKIIDEYLREFPPDVGAAIFWLKNKKTDIWTHEWQRDNELKKAQAQKLRQEMEIDKKQLAGTTGDGIEIIDDIGSGTGEDQNKDQRSD